MNVAGAPPGSAIARGRQVFPRPRTAQAMARVRLRMATLDDLDILVRHRRGMWEATFPLPEARLDAADRAYRRWARPRLKNGRMVGWIVESMGGEPVASGCLYLAPQQPHPLRPGLAAPYLMSMFTEPAHRGKGYATRIVRESIRWARSRGYPVVILHASEFGESLYLKEGFERGREMRLRLDRTGPPRRARALQTS